MIAELCWSSLSGVVALVVFQVVVQLSVMVGKRREEARQLQQQSLRRMSAGSFTGVNDASDLDGDEPPVFFQMVGQTGSEMLMVSMTHSTLLTQELLQTGKALLCSRMPLVLCPHFLFSLPFWFFPVSLLVVYHRVRDPLKQSCVNALVVMNKTKRQCYLSRPVLRKSRVSLSFLHQTKHKGPKLQISPSFFVNHLL
jgi:hypothetical protein